MNASSSPAGTSKMLIKVTLTLCSPFGEQGMVRCQPSRSPGGFARGFPELANLDTYADTNNLVVLYPQAIASVIPVNPEGCWDWWGYDGPDFAVKTAPQMVTIMNMVTALGG